MRRWLRRDRDRPRSCRHRSGRTAGRRVPQTTTSIHESGLASAARLSRTKASWKGRHRVCGFSPDAASISARYSSRIWSRSRESPSRRARMASVRRRCSAIDRLANRNASSASDPSTRRLDPFSDGVGDETGLVQRVFRSLAVRTRASDPDRACRPRAPARTNSHRRGGATLSAVRSAGRSASLVMSVTSPASCARSAGLAGAVRCTSCVGRYVVRSDWSVWGRPVMVRR